MEVLISFLPRKTKSINVKVFKMMANKNEAKTMKPFL